MSIIKRPAKCSGFSFENISNTIYKEPSYETKLKSESVKQHLEKHYKKLFTDIELRKNRLKVFKRKLRRSKISEEEKEIIFKKFLEEESNFNRLIRTRLKSTRYQRLKLIGRGGFGEVWLVRDNITSNLYALKILKKTAIIFNDQIPNVMSERNALSIINNPWIVGLQCSFQDQNFLYLVLEYAPGGDLMSLLIKFGSFKENIAKFYFAEILLALNSVHEMGYLHRDLKPDNILISQTGHIKLTDFGLAKNYKKTDIKHLNIIDKMQEIMVDSTINTNRNHHQRDLIGSLDYTAPEIFQQIEHSISSDYWSLGVILYEMLFGRTPFYSNSSLETALRITQWRKSLRLTNDGKLSPYSLDLIKQLLCDSDQRITFNQIINHPFLKGYNLNNPNSNTPPLVPLLSSPDDTRNFDIFEPLFTNENLNELPSYPLQNFAFFGFTFKSRPENFTKNLFDQLE